MFPLNSLILTYFYFISFCALSRCYSHTERSKRSKLCKRRAKLYDSHRTEDDSFECRTLRRHSNNQKMNFSCRDCVLCPICKGNKILCCRFNINNIMGIFLLYFDYECYKIITLIAFNFNMSNCIL